MNAAWIVAAARSPIGRAQKGALIDVRPDDLAAIVVKEAIARARSLDPDEVEDVILGCAQPAGEHGYVIARVAGLLAGLHDVPGTTVNRYCASSMQAIRMAAHAIRAGEGDVFVAGGVECVSRFAKGRSDGLPDTKNPRFAAAEARTAARAQGGAPPWSPSPELPDIYIAMGQTAENVAELHRVTREEMDEYAARSQARAVAAAERGFFDGELVPLAALKRDECPRPGTTVERLAALAPVFRPDGRVTAGNACPLNDGASAVVVMSERRARALKLDPLGRIVATAVSALDPEIMGMGPVEASRRALARAGLTMAEIDLVEINEAFAAQVIPSARALEIPIEKLNVNGGAIALGHPFGMTGARLVLTLLGALAERRGRYGLATLCVGGGQGMAVVVERA
jgi:acetyl-CoA C-acetyltransferase